jgi:hypothetical protein
MVGLVLVLRPEHDPFVPPRVAATAGPVFSQSIGPAYERRVDAVMFDWGRFPAR